MNAYLIGLILLQNRTNDNPSLDLMCAQLTERNQLVRSLQLTYSIDVDGERTYRVLSGWRAENRILQITETERGGSTTFQLKSGRYLRAERPADSALAYPKVLYSVHPFHELNQSQNWECFDFRPFGMDPGSWFRRSRLLIPQSDSALPSDRYVFYHAAWPINDEYATLYKYEYDFSRNMIVGIQKMVSYHDSSLLGADNPELVLGRNFYATTEWRVHEAAHQGLITIPTRMSLIVGPDPRLPRSDTSKYLLLVDSESVAINSEEDFDWIVPDEQYVTVDESTGVVTIPGGALPEFMEANFEECRELAAHVGGIGCSWHLMEGPVRSQIMGAPCGLTAAYFFSVLAGSPVPWDELLSAWGNRDSTWISVSDLLRIMKNHGFQLRARRIDAAELSSLRSPFILLMNPASELLGHYAAGAIVNNYLHVLDPLEYRRDRPVEDVIGGSGAVICLVPYRGFPFEYSILAAIVVLCLGVWLLRPRISCLVALLLVLLPVSSCTAETAGKLALLSDPNPVLNAAKGTRIVEHSFHIVNRSTEWQSVESITATCGCTDYALSHNPIPPFTEAALSIAIDVHPSEIRLVELSLYGPKSSLTPLLTVQATARGQMLDIITFLPRKWKISGLLEEPSTDYTGEVVIATESERIPQIQLGSLPGIAIDSRFLATARAQSDAAYLHKYQVTLRLTDDLALSQSIQRKPGVVLLQVSTDSPLIKPESVECFFLPPRRYWCTPGTFRLSRESPTAKIMLHWDERLERGVPDVLAADKRIRVESGNPGSGQLEITVSLDPSNLPDSSVSRLQVLKPNSDTAVLTVPFSILDTSRVPD